MLLSVPAHDRPDKPVKGKEFLPQACFEPIDSLIIGPRNARIHTKTQVTYLKKSLEEAGCVSPVLIDSNKRVIAGHGRLLAARKAGWTNIPTVSVDHLTPHQIEKLKVDNRIAELAEWDDKLLGEHLQQLVLAEPDIDFTGAFLAIGEAIVTRLMSYRNYQQDNRLPRPAICGCLEISTACCAATRWSLPAMISSWTENWRPPYLPILLTMYESMVM